MGLIFYLSSRDGDQSHTQSNFITDFVVNIFEMFRKDSAVELAGFTDVVDFMVRKAAHMTEYGVLFLWLYFAFVHAVEKGGKIVSKFLAVLVTFLYACTDELHQLLVAERSGKAADVIIDMCGVVIFLLYMWALKNKKRRVAAAVITFAIVLGICGWYAFGNFA